MAGDDAQRGGPTSGLKTVSVTPGSLATVTGEPAPALAEGSRLGSFRIEGRLGQGGLGVVYRAYDDKLKRPVAIKVLADASFAGARLLEEARRAASLTHPSIAAIYEVREHDGVSFIVMELVEGETLRARIRSGPLHVGDAFHVAREIAAGLSRAHKSGIVHRDLKPENVMVTPDGGVKILDFGLAREVVVAGRNAASAPTSETGLAGTPGYMSPEQASRQHVDARSDVYSFGVLLHEMLAGARPQGGAMRLPESVPRALAGVVATCLEQAPERRPADGAEILGALRGLVIAPAPPQKPARGYTFWAPMMMLPLVGAVIVELSRDRHASAGRDATSVSLVPSSSPSPPPRAVAVTDLPTPATTSADARAAYEEGMLAERQGNNGTLRAALRKATKADPQMAAAWLRLAIVEFFTNDLEGARDALRKATVLEATLDEHDRALEGAASAMIMSDPPDWEDFASRLATATERFPMDAELSDHYAFALFRLARYADARDAFARTMALDPQMGDPYLFRANAQAALGDLPGALATTDACDRNLPASSVCARPRHYLHEQLGDCAALENDGRAEAARDPASDGYATVADALATEGKPREAVRGALDLWLGKVDAEYRKKLDVEFSMLLADWSGDFAEAERLARDLAKLTATNASEDDQGVPLAVLAATLAEEGRDGEARRVAERYLVRQPTWLSGNRYSVAGLRSSFVPAMLLLARPGMAAGEFDRRRDAWAHDWVAHVAGSTKHAVWLAAYAAVAEDARDAQRALEVLPEYAPLPLFRPGTTWYAAEGYVRLLAGDAARALPLLERGSRVCLGLSDSFGHVGAELHLGMAREQTGDRDGACAAYAAVVAQWGNAKPRSVTAEAALGRAKALGCATSP